MSAMFGLALPREDVLKGSVSEAEFAARLGPVISADGPVDYVDPARFFSNTYPTKGLKELLDQVLRRLTGTSGAVSSVFRLDTSFGGGKTHGLIALIHAARAGTSVPNLDEFAAGIPKMSGARVAAFDGEAADPTNGRPLEPGVRAYTPWGEIAWQLGGKPAFDVIKPSDEARRAPGADTLREMIGDEPTLIVLDELGEWLRKCPEAGGRDQIPAFIKALFSAVESSPRAALVFTLAVRSDGTANDAFSSENQQLAKIMAEAESVAGRKATILNPTSDEETVAVLRRRLFERVDPMPSGLVAAYRARWSDDMDKGSGNAAERLAECWPFHPDLIDVLTDKTSTIAEFQRVRGMLRILAKTVASVWETKPDDADMIHVHHIDLGAEEIRREFTTRLQQGAFDPAILNDVAGTLEKPALAEELDNLHHGGLPSYTRYLARTIFVHSIAFNHDLQGLSAARLRFSMAAPKLDPDMTKAALQRFLGDSAYLDDRPGSPLKFNAAANLQQIVNRETKRVDKETLRTELDSRIKDIFGGGTKATFDLVAFPAGPFDVEDIVDDGRPRLVLFHHQHMSVGHDIDKVPDLVERIFSRKGSDEKGIRMLRNNLVFLLADEKKIEDIEAAMARRLALRALIQADRIKDLADYQQEKVRQEEAKSEMAVAQTIQGCYRHLLYPSKNQLGGGNVPLAHAVIDAPGTAADPGAGQKQVLRYLRDAGKIRSAEDPADQPAFIRDRTPLKKGQMTTAAMREEFRTDVTLPIHLGDDPLKKVIIKGIEDGVFVYRHEGLMAGQGDPIPSIRIEESAVVLTMDYAKAHGIWPRPAPTPASGAAPGVSPATSGASPAAAPPETGDGQPQAPTGGPASLLPIGGPAIPGISEPKEFQKSGPLKDALEQLFNAVKAAKTDKLTKLTIEPVDYSDGFKLLSPSGSLTMAHASATIKAALEMPDGELEIDMKGSAKNAQNARSWLEGQVRAAADKSVDVKLEYAFDPALDVNGPGPQAIIDTLTKFGTAAAFVTARAEN